MDVELLVGVVPVMIGCAFLCALHARQMLTSLVGMMSWLTAYALMVAEQNVAAGLVAFIASSVTFLGIRVRMKWEREQGRRG